MKISHRGWHVPWLPGNVSRRAQLGMESGDAFVWGREWAGGFYPSSKATAGYGHLRMKAVRCPAGRDAVHTVCWDTDG